jgi:Asp-tRNA(Asn)/Glu-tRNA(Gln) amidotransferase C subunit
MTEITLDESKLKELLKTALFELMQEEKAMFSELLSDVIEEIAMSNAIKEGENTEIVSQEEIFKILEK